MAKLVPYSPPSSADGDPQGVGQGYEGHTLLIPAVWQQEVLHLLRQLITNVSHVTSSSLGPHIPSLDEPFNKSLERVDIWKLAGVYLELDPKLPPDCQTFLDLTILEDHPSQDDCTLVKGELIC